MAAGLTGSCTHMCPYLCVTVLVHLFAQLIQLKKPVEDHLIPDAFVKFPSTLASSCAHQGVTGTGQDGLGMHRLEGARTCPARSGELPHLLTQYCAIAPRGTEQQWMPASTPEAYVILMH